MKRRDLLTGIGAFSLLPLPLRAGAPAGLFVTCAARYDGSFAAAGFDDAGRLRFEIPLPERGHGMAFRPRRLECAVFARRPGMFLLVLDLPTGQAAHWVESEPGRHYYGHGAFASDGRLLFATENDFEGGRGVLGVYDAADNYRRVGEIPCNGIGPHQTRPIPGGDALAVANGGILTHPLRGRDKLNLDTMAPNLSVLRWRDGAVLRRYALPAALHTLSIRHIDIDRRERIAVSMQYEGDLADDVALVAMADPASGIRLLRAPKAVERRLRQYTGAVAFDSLGRYVAASGPRGGLAVIWDAHSGDYLRHVDAPDTSGVAATVRPGEFMLSGGDGTIRLVQADTGRVTLLAGPNRAHRWDNHLEGTTTDQISSIGSFSP